MSQERCPRGESLSQTPLGEGLDEQERSGKRHRQVRKGWAQSSGVGGIPGAELAGRAWEGKWLVLGLHLLFPHLQIP